MAFQSSDINENQSTGSEPVTPSNFSMRVLRGDTLDAPAKVLPGVEESSMNMSRIPMKLMVGGVVAVLILGVGTGLGAAYFNASRNPQITANQMAAPEEIESGTKVGAVFGVADEKTFRDSTEGVLIKGGIDGEGSHTLVRPGGKDQNVYLTSSVVDLDQFNNMKIKISGETFKGQKAGWLMDVGRVEIQSLEGELPEWYKKEQAKMQKAAPSEEE